MRDFKNDFNTLDYEINDFILLYFNIHSCKTMY